MIQEDLQKYVKVHQYTLQKEKRQLEKKKEAHWRSPLVHYILDKKINQKIEQKEQEMVYDSILLEMLMQDTSKVTQMTYNQVEEILNLVQFYMQNPMLWKELEQRTELTPYLIERGFTETAIYLFYKIQVCVNSKQIKAYHKNYFQI